MKDDLISRKAVLNVIYEMHDGGREAVEKALPNTYGEDLREIAEQISMLPTAQPEPKKGEWIKERIGYTYEDDEWIKKVYIYQVTCPYCGDEMTMGTNEEVDFTMKRNKFCKNCGADMRGGEKQWRG